MLSGLLIFSDQLKPNYFKTSKSTYLLPNCCHAHGYSRSAWAGMFGPSHSCPFLWDDSQETAWIFGKASLVSTLSNTFSWNKFQSPVWEKVTFGLIAGTFNINRLHHQHNFIPIFSFLWFYPPPRAVGRSIEDSCNFSSKAQQAPFNQQQQRHSKKQ